MSTIRVGRPRSAPTPAFVLAALFLAGCGAVRPSAMIPDPVEVHARKDGRVVVETSTRSERAYWSPGAFLEALVESTRRSALFSAVGTAGRSDYRLNVDVVDIAQPGFGFTMTVKIGADWKLTKTDTNQVVVKEFVQSTCSKTVGDAFAGATRLRLTTECAARENIREGLRRLAAAPGGP